MIVTEAQAKELRCCGPAGCGYRPGGPDALGNLDRLCCGSACMAWTWRDHQQNVYEKERPQGEDWQRLGNFWTRTPKEGKPYRVRECGLLP